MSDLTNGDEEYCQQLYRTIGRFNVGVRWVVRYDDFIGKTIYECCYSYSNHKTAYKLYKNFKSYMAKEANVRMLAIARGLTTV